MTMSLVALTIFADGALPMNHARKPLPSVLVNLRDRATVRIASRIQIKTLPYSGLSFPSSVILTAMRHMLDCPRP